MKPRISLVTLGVDDLEAGEECRGRLPSPRPDNTAQPTSAPMRHRGRVQPLAGPEIG
jgi:hypothetical protein